MVEAKYLAKALDSIAPNSWKQLTYQELEKQGYAGYSVGWQINLDLIQVAAPNVNHLVIVIDESFPNSQIRVVAPQLGSNFIWPHTEQNGFLCLRPTLTTADIEKRVKQHFNDAIELLSYSEQQNTQEFTREFIAYWGQRITKNPRELSILSLVRPSYHGEEVFYFYISSMMAYVIADSKEELSGWLKNMGLNVTEQQIDESILWVLKKPWVPSEFPTTAAMFIDDIKSTLLVSHAKSKKSLPLLIKTFTPTGIVFVAVLLKPPEKKKLLKGFRSLDLVPQCVYRNHFRYLKIERLSVNRVDAPWVHGRDHNLELNYLLARKVLLVGCGSLGSKIAKTLSEAGVGELCFVDGDVFESHNPSRHLLGVASVNKAKAIELARKLANKYPHLKFNTIATARFELLNEDQLKSLEDIDLIITAGIDYEGEQAVESWRKSLTQPPMLLSSWVEPYALAGHAVLIINQDALLDRFTNEEPGFHLIKWPESMQLEITEAGCGNTFQPHGAVDLNYTANMAARCVLDALLGLEQASVIYSWLGDTNKIQELGGDLADSSLNPNGYFKRAWDRNL